MGDTRIGAVQLIPAQERIGAESYEAETIRDDAYFIENFGITKAEADQIVEYPGQEPTTFGEVLHHEGCPVGAGLREANDEGGRDAVVAKIGLYGQIVTSVNIELDDPGKYELAAKKKS